jgi:hypothetical protein
VTRIDRPLPTRGEAIAADLGVLSRAANMVHGTAMKSPRTPSIRLMTVAQAADRLGLTVAAVDAAVATGALPAVCVSARGGRRFWPADVEAFAALSSDDAGGSMPSADMDTPVVSVAAGRVRVAAQRSDRETLAVRRWFVPFEPAVERPASSYLAFRDAEHVTSYLRARSALLFRAETSVHADAAPAARELVTA